MYDYKEMYCLKSESVNACSEYGVIHNKSSRFLSYSRYFNVSSKENNLKIYVKLSRYKMIQKNFDTFSDEELYELLEILKEVYAKLKQNNAQDKLIEKTSILLNQRGFEIDLFIGLLLEDGIVFFNDSQSETMQYRKSIIKGGA